MRKPMRLVRVLLAIALGWMALLPPASGGAPPALDAVVVVDDSGSMRTNDPSSLTAKAVVDFARNLPADARLAVIAFAEKPAVVLPFTATADEAFSQQLDAALARLDHRGRLTDLPAAVERALYLLRHEGRPHARRAVLYVTDGIVDVGSAAASRDRARWLREDLASDARSAGIPIFGVALTEAADFELIQSTATTTGGDYYRVLTADEVSPALQSIARRMSEASPSAVAPPPAGASAPSLQTIVIEKPVLVDKPVVVERPTPPPAASPWLALGGAGLVAVALALWLRRRPATATESPVPDAYLLDASGCSNAERHRVGLVTRIGREAEGNEVVIAKATVTARHARIVWRGGGFHLEDLRSTNGTRVGAHRFSSPDAVQSIALKHGDEIVLANEFELRFMLAAHEGGARTVLAGEAAGPISRPGDADEAQPPQGPAALPAPPAADEPQETVRKPDNCARHLSVPATELCAVCGVVVCRICMRRGDDGDLVHRDCPGIAA